MREETLLPVLERTEQRWCAVIYYFESKDDENEKVREGENESKRKEREGGLGLGAHPSSFFPLLFLYIYIFVFAFFISTVELGVSREVDPPRRVAWKGLLIALRYHAGGRRVEPGRL